MNSRLSRSAKGRSRAARAGFLVVGPSWVMVEHGHELADDPLRKIRRTRCCRNPNGGIERDLDTDRYKSARSSGQASAIYPSAPSPSVSNPSCAFIAAANGSGGP